MQMHSDRFPVSMKKRIQFISIFILMLTAFSSYAQKEWDASGVWTGTLFNDSTKKFIPFEIAISYHNEKYSGYTYTVFLIDSIENIGVKEVTIKEKNGLIVIRDKKLIDDNYADAPAKGVYTTLELYHSENDTADILSGRWYTNKTREYYPLSGVVFVAKRKNIFATRIIPKLKSLGLADQLSFYSYQGNKDVIATSQKISERKIPEKDTMMTVVEPAVVITVPKKSNPVIQLPKSNELKQLIDSIHSSEKKNTTTTDNRIQLPQQNISAKSPEDNSPEKIRSKPSISVNERTKSQDQKLLTGQKETADNKPVITKEKVSDEHPTVSKELKPITPFNSDTLQTANDVQKDKLQIQISKPENAKSVSANKKPSENTSVQLSRPPSLPKVDISSRKIETIRTVPVTGDSLVLSLFDNGSVDGDTVSVLINGKVIISRVGLLETAYNETIHLTPEMGDSIKIILYAENLGSIPPNTGLLVVRNGGQDYEIRFSGDLTKNSAIILLRNKKE